MAAFTATTTFLHGRDRYEEGETYDAPLAQVAYFVGNGWATSDEVADINPEAAPADVTLDVQDVEQGHTSNEVN